jgi:hypothetical protein
MWNLLEGGFTPEKFGEEIEQLIDLGVALLEQL